MSISTKIVCVFLGSFISVISSGDYSAKKMIIPVDISLEENLFNTNDLSREIQKQTAIDLKLLQASFNKEWKLYLRQQRMDQLQADLTCLADNIYSEAAFEPEEGKLAVAIVTLNRVKDPIYPKTICAVVYERHLNPRNNKITCQFSWTCKPRHSKIVSIYKEVTELARQVLLKKIIMEELDDVTLYHAEYVHPEWADKVTMVKQIGQHIFYRGL